MVTRGKPKLNVTIDQEAIDWIAAKVADHTFASMSHGVEYCVFRCMREESEGGQPKEK